MFLKRLHLFCSYQIGLAGNHTPLANIGMTLLEQRNLLVPLQTLKRFVYISSISLISFYSELVLTPMFVNHYTRSFKSVSFDVHLINDTIHFSSFGILTFVHGDLAHRQFPMIIEQRIYWKRLQLIKMDLLHKINQSSIRKRLVSSNIIFHSMVDCFNLHLIVYKKLI